MSSNLTGVGAVLSAAHYGPSGALHGHTWEVVAWFPAGTDALALQRRLEERLASFDHGVLPAELSWAEPFAAYLGAALDGCIGVDVSRPSERLYARWRA